MTQYNTLNVKLSNSELSKKISGIKNCTKVSTNFVGNSNNVDNFFKNYF